MTAPWYAIEDMRLPNRPVRVRWGAWVGTAVLLQAARGGAVAWAEPVREGKKLYFDPLPTRAMVETMAAGQEPDGWQPLDGEPWPHALGAPLPVQPHHISRFSTIGGVAFDATTAAAEMEATRDDARRTPDAPVREQLPWWRLVEAVTYSPPGQISEREAEGRIMRALYFLNQREQPRPYRSNAQIIADLKGFHDVVPREDATADYVPRLRTTRRDNPDELLRAMEWFCEMALGPRTGWTRAFVLKERAHNMPRSFASIAGVIGTKDQRGAHNTYARAIIRIAAIANANATPRLDAIRAATKEGNRRHALAR